MSDETSFDPRNLPESNREKLAPKQEVADSSSQKPPQPQIPDQTDELQRRKDEQDIAVVRARLQNLAEQESNPIKDLLIKEIENSGGRITFERFMELSLYGNVETEDSKLQGVGYFSSGDVKISYTRDKEAGIELGHFKTSPEVSSAFGHSFAYYLEELWEQMGKPESFDVAEMGAGNGTFARDILEYVRDNNPEFSKAVKYKIVEIGQGLIDKQKEKLKDFPVEWVLASATSLPLRNVRGAFISNELVDNFPVHRINLTKGNLTEKYVTYQEGQFKEIEGEISDPRLGTFFEYLREQHSGKKSGDAYVNLRALDWMKQVSDALDSGFVITVDYGGNARRVRHTNVRTGAVGEHYQSESAEPAYENVGRVDITSTVDFSALKKEGERNGLQTVGLTTQGQFLEKNGFLWEIRERHKQNVIEYLEGKITRKELVKRYRDFGPDLDLVKNVSGPHVDFWIKHISGKASGDLKVLVQAKNTETREVRKSMNQTWRTEVRVDPYDVIEEFEDPEWNGKYGWEQYIDSGDIVRKARTPEKKKLYAEWLKSHE